MLNYTFLATKEEIASLDCRTIADYRYIALIELGKYAAQIEQHEYTLICIGLSRYLKEDCLITIASELAEAPDDSTLKSAYQIFDPLPNCDAFIALGTLFPDENEKLYSAPTYQEINWESRQQARRPYYDALNQSLSKLRDKLYYSTVEDFSLPPLPPSINLLVLPNAKRIKDLRKKLGLNQSDMTHVQIPGSNEHSGADRKTIIRAEKGEPVQKETIQHIAYCLNESITSLHYTQVVPLSGAILLAKDTIINCDRSKITEWFGPHYEYFFDILNASKIVSAEVALRVYYYYKKIANDMLNEEIELSEIVNYSRTETLAENTRIENAKTS